MIWDPSINLGSLVVALSMVIGGFGVLFGMRGDLRRQSDQLRLQGEAIKGIEGDLKAMTGILVSMARYESKQYDMDRRISRLEGIAPPAGIGN